MTLQQEAYSRIDQMTDDGIRVLIDMIDKMKTVSVTGFKNTGVTDSNVNKKKRFMQSAGRIKVDAIN